MKHCVHAPWGSYWEGRGYTHTPPCTEHHTHTRMHRAGIHTKHSLARSHTRLARSDHKKRSLARSLTSSAWLSEPFPSRSILLNCSMASPSPVIELNLHRPETPGRQTEPCVYGDIGGWTMSSAPARTSGAGPRAARPRHLHPRRPLWRARVE